MINLREADVTQTRFYQQVVQITEVNMVIRQLESLGKALLDFQDMRGGI